MIDRTRLMLLVVGLCVGSAAVGAIAASALDSPEDAVAEASLEPSRATAEVTSGALTSDLVLRGDVVFDDAIPVRGFGLDGEVVTAAPPPAGTTLGEGDVVLEVAERPVLLLEGALPMYRDLRLGMSGRDVEQLQQALARLGHYDGTADGAYDAETAGAVARLFEAQGHEPPAADPELVRRVEQAEESVETAERDLERARNAARREGTRRSEILAAEAELRRAEGQLEVAEARAAAAVTDAEGALADARRALDAARERRQDLAERCEQAAGADADGDDDTACDELEEAEDAERAAARAVGERERALELAGLESELGVQTAEDAVESARARLAEAREGPAASQSEVALAEEELAAAEDALSEAEAELAAVARRSEFVFAPSAPAQLTAVHADLGTPADDVLAELSAAQLVVETAVSSSDRALVEVGQAAEVESEELGVTVPGRVAAVADEPGGGDLASHQFRMTVALDDAPATDRLQGLNVKVVVPLASTDGDVLSVPVSALVSSEDQRVRVYVDDQADGSLRPVVVRPGLASGGLVEVTPVDGELAAGDRVVVSGEPDTSDTPDAAGEPSGSGGE